MSISPIPGESLLQARPAYPTGKGSGADDFQPAAPDSVTLSGSGRKVSATLSPHLKMPAEEETKPTGVAEWLRRAAAGAMAAISVAGAMAFPAPASAAPPIIPDSSISVTLGSGSAVTQTAQTKVSAVATQQAKRVAERREKNALVDEMVGRSSINRSLSPKTMQKLRDDLSVLPVDVLRAINANQTRIVVLREGQSLIDAGVIAPIDMRPEYGDVRALRNVVDESLREVEGKYDAKIAQLDRDIARASAAYKKSGSDKDYLAMSELQSRRLATELAKNEAFYINVYEKTGGRVEKHMVLSGDPSDTFFGRPLSLIEVSLDEIADLHGARTPEEKKEFISLIRALNGGRLTAAQDRFKAEYEKFYPDVPPYETLSETARPFLARDERIVVPSYYYYRSDAGSAKPAALFSTHDFLANNYWKSGLVSGQYFYQGDINTIVVPEKGIGTRKDGRSSVVHEAGHAYQDALMQLDPASGDNACRSVNAAFERMGAEDGKGFPSGYASTNPSELFAESFAVRFGEKPDALRKLNPKWAQSFESITGASSSVAKSSRKASRTLVCPYNPYETPSK
jgi:hypothetical protein